MVSSHYGYVGLLLLVSSQCLVFASLNYEKNKTEDSTELIGSYLTLPWIDGLNSLVHSSGSPDAEEVETFIRAIIAGEIWAKQILDTLWKSTPTWEARPIQCLKKYDQCSEGNADNDTDIEDRHCMVSTVDTISEDTGISVFMSDPSLPNKFRKNQTTADEVTQSIPGGPKDFTTAEISVIFFFSMLSVVLIACTICDFVKRNRSCGSSATVNTLAKFSLYTNALSLFNTKSTEDAMPAIHGLRCLSFWTVIFGHRYVLSALLMNRWVMLLDFVQGKNTFFGIFFEMTPLAVDIFCVISGFLLAHMFLKIKKSGFQFNVFTMYLYRYLRLTPCLAAVLLFVAIFSHRFGSGPMWERLITIVVDPCRKNWWINLLYLQNVVAPDRICMVHTWYLALDMQLFWLSPFILYPLYHSPKFGLWLLSLSLVASVFTPAIVLAVHGYSNLWLRLDMDFPKLLDNFNYYYISTYTRACPHLVGILLGYDVATKRRHLTTLNVAMNWILTGSLILFCTWLNNRNYNSGFVGGWDMEILTSILLRPLWSIAIAWVIYACTQGYGGFATRFLSLPIFFPLSRLSYCIYLVHVVLQVITISSHIESSDPSTSYHIFNGVFGDLVVATAVAFILNLFIEGPSIVFTKILLGNRGHKPEAVPGEKVSKDKASGVASNIVIK